MLSYRFLSPQKRPPSVHHCRIYFRLRFTLAKLPPTSALQLASSLDQMETYDTVIESKAKQTEKSQRNVESSPLCKSTKISQHESGGSNLQTREKASLTSFGEYTYLPHM